MVLTKPETQGHLHYSIYIYKRFKSDMTNSNISFMIFIIGLFLTSFD